MTIIKRSVAFCLLMMISVPTFAERWHTGHIRSIYPLSNGNFVLTFMEPVVDCNSGAVGVYLYSIVGANGMSQEGNKMIFSAAMAAAAMGKRVSVAYDEATPSCQINRLSVRVGIN